MVLSFIINEYIDGLFILFVVLIDDTLGSIQEYRSNKNAEALASHIKILKCNKIVTFFSLQIPIKSDIIH